jgi:hypothetical protein
MGAMSKPVRAAPVTACLIALLLGTMTGCGDVTPAPSAEPSAAPSIRAATTPPSAPSSSPEANASLAPIGVADIGTDAWKLIATDTNVGAFGETAILGNVQNGVGWVLTCTGNGSLRLSLLASTSQTAADPATSPSIVVATTYQCPTTEVGEDFTGQYDGGAVSISPNVDHDENVIYRLLVATLPR